MGGHLDIPQTFDDLAQQLIRHYERRRARVQSTAQLLRSLHRSWVRFVRESATTHQMAPVSSIVTQGYEVGWRVWGRVARSKLRYAPRIASWGLVYQRIVRRWYEAALRDESPREGGEES